MTPIYILACSCAFRIQLKKLARIFAWSLFASFSVCSLIYFLSLYYLDNRIAKFEGYVRLNPSSFSQNNKKIAIFVDESVLGKYYGKTIRRAQNAIADISLDVFSDTDEVIHTKYDAIILCGRTVNLLKSGNLNGNKIIIVNPIGLPKDALVKPSLIYLPSFDRFNQNVHWLNYAKKLALPYMLIEDSDQQISGMQLAKAIAGF